MGQIVMAPSGYQLFYTFHLLPLSLVKYSDTSFKVEESRAPEWREKCALNTPLLGYVNSW